ncbi:hypothetical protein EcoAe3A3_31030 [Escherichia coli]|nr:hypothetical protein EcoAe3A3_31030 [Escherichia coli]
MYSLSGEMKLNLHNIRNLHFELLHKKKGLRRVPSKFRLGLHNKDEVIMNIMLHYSLKPEK